MPELPELEALAERMTESFAGQSISGVDVLGFSALKTFAVPPEKLTGKALEEVTRRGKYTVMAVPPYRVLIHLSQGGRIDFEVPVKRTKPRGSVARFRFESGGFLVKEFGTERKAAWWILQDGETGPLEGLGPEPTSEEFEDLIVSGTDGRQLHTMLRDQRTVAGIGRGFADDILHASQLSPFASLKSLDAGQRANLLARTRSVLVEATERERSRSGGLPAKMGDRFTIHNHFGEPCPRCATKMEHVSYESREVIYCPTCQTGGKILADRRMSRLLK